MDTPSELLWHRSKEKLSREVPPQQFQTWIQPLSFVSGSPTTDGIHITLSVPSDFHRNWIEKEYSTAIQRLLSEEAACQVSFSFLIQDASEIEAVGSEVVASDVMASEAIASGNHARPGLPARDLPTRDFAPRVASSTSFGQASDSSRQMDAPAGAPAKGNVSANRTDVLSESESARKNGLQNTNRPGTSSRFDFKPETIPGALPRTLNPRYTFDAFIEADCNRLARSAGVAVSKRPGETSFNPFLIYGKVGLGKTHLAHAIGNQIAIEQPRAQVLYLTSEAFTNYFVYAIQNNTLGEFTHAFRQIDVLIVDDIQFFGGKEKTQEQFFHLFNDLHQRGKQIILCADRSPAEIAGVEERLLSRFRWGLSADVQPPDLETRTAILRKHALASELELSGEVIDYIAYNVKDNIRLLEGAFNRLLALHQVTKKTIDLNFVQDALQDLIDNRTRKSISAEQIRDIVAEYFEMDPDLLIGKSRKRPIVDARQVAMHFCKQMTQHSLEAIGRRFGGRDHSTVIHACKAIQARIDTDPRFVEDLERIEQLLKNRVLHS